MPNLIVILFNLIYPIFYVGFLVRVVYVRESVKTQGKARSQDRIVTAGFRECLTGKAFPRDTRETFCFVNLSYLIYTISTHTIYTHIIHKC